MGVKRKLYVTATLYLKLSDKLDSRIVKHLEVVIVKSHDGCNDHTVTGVNANGVDVLHTTDGDRVVSAVAHNLELDLLISLYALLYKNLMNGGCRKCADRKLAKLLFGICKSAACTTKGERGTKNYGIADLCRCRYRLLKCVRDVRGDDRLADRFTKCLEKLSVLGSLNRLGRGTEELYAGLTKDALLFKLHRKVKSGLSTDTGYDRVGTLVSDDLCHVLKSKRLHIHLVRDGGVGHYGRGVRVDEDYLVSLLLKCKTRLCSCIVELCCLSDYDGAGADDHNSFEVCSLCHFYISSKFYKSNQLTEKSAVNINGFLARHGKKASALHSHTGVRRTSSL